jgi:hypothetical protein
MEENTPFFSIKDDSNNTADLLGNDKPLLDMEGFETLESSSKFVSDHDNNPGLDKLDEFSDNLQSGLMSTTRPLSTSKEDIKFDDRSISPSIPTSNLSEFENDKNSSLIDSIADTRVEDPFHDPAQRSDGDRLLIDQDTHDTELFFSSDRAGGNSPVSSKTLLESEIVESLPKVKDPKIGSQAKEESDNYDFEACAYETAAQPAVKREVAMEAETLGNAKNSECECPFTAAAWFNPEKLHPTVAEYVYWRDPKKSGIAFGASLVLLLSLKYFSFISVVAYITLALLCVTVSFRIYKNVLQAVQKSNEGHPFKDYLEMDITLSQDKVSETVEVLISHVNCVTGKLRSLVLVEDLFDTLKLAVLAWCLTYVGAWFNGLTLVILALVSAFTFPKVYETNKAQIDMYAEIVRTKSKEVIDMVNAKMPMGKKKKDQ